MRQNHGPNNNSVPQINDEKVSEILNSDLFSQFIVGEADNEDVSKPLTNLDKAYIETFFDQINTILEKFWTTSKKPGASSEENGKKALEFLLIIWDKCAKGSKSEHLGVQPLRIVNPSLLTSEIDLEKTSISSSISRLNAIATRYIDLDNHTSSTVKQTAEALGQRREAFSQVLKICIEETMGEIRKTKEGERALFSLQRQSDYQTILLEISKWEFNRKTSDDHHQLLRQFADQYHQESILSSRVSLAPSPYPSSPRIEQSRSPSPPACNGCNAQ